MPQKRNNPEPPPTMTWGKAVPVITVAGLLDLLRMFFEMFWFFGPALAALACTGIVNNAVNTSVTTLAGKAVATGCTAAAGVAGFFGVEITETFGIIMADAVALLGFLILLLWVLMTNARLFKADGGMFWFVASFGLSEIPFIGTFPAFSVVLYMLYRRQIKADATALKRWKEEQAERQRLEREEQRAQILQLRNAQAAEDMQNAMNEDQYEAQSPDELLRAA